MRVIGKNREGTKILVGKHEAALIFTPEGVHQHFPKELVEKATAMEAYEYTQKYNPTLGIYMDVCEDLRKISDNA